MLSVTHYSTFGFPVQPVQQKKTAQGKAKAFGARLCVKVSG